MICEVCQQRIEGRVSRGPLQATTNPLRIYHHGLPLPFTGYAAAILMHLMRFPRSSTPVLSMVGTGEDVEDPFGQVRVTICRMRKKLPEGVRIDTVYGWGYALVID